jgi:hypothetical protein
MLPVPGGLLASSLSAALVVAKNCKDCSHENSTNDKGYLILNPALL